MSPIIRPVALAKDGDGVVGVLFCYSQTTTEIS